MDFDSATPLHEHHSPADELALACVDRRGVWLYAPDGATVALGWDELRAEAQTQGPASGLFRDLLARAEQCLLPDARCCA